MKRVLVLGDNICDVYRHHTATRISPEAPVPVLVKTQETYSTSGGAGLVADQLIELLGSDRVVYVPGSHSVKERIFADDRLMLRIDSDSENPIVPAYIFGHSLEGYDAIVISDYDKGALIEPTAKYVILKAKEFNTPVFVDAKKNWKWYEGCFAAFPNEKELLDDSLLGHDVIRKLGPNGCSINGVHIPTKERKVRDCTGAGDCFLAAFVAQWLKYPNAQDRLRIAACHANDVAGISVEYVGTHVVTKKELDERPD